MIIEQNLEAAKLIGEINEVKTEALFDRFFELNNKNTFDPILLYVSTQGGYVRDMFHIYDLIRLSRRPVYTLGIGQVMSGGMLLLAAGNNGNRYVSKYCTLLMHEMSAGAIGKVTEVENELEELNKLNKQIIKAYIAETGLRKKELEKIFKQRFDVIIPPEDAVKLGFCDKVI